MPSLMPLARSQFFFSKNFSITRTALSCGSRLSLGIKPKPQHASPVKQTVSSSLFKRLQNVAKTSRGNRQFSTSLCRSSIAASEKSIHKAVEATITSSVRLGAQTTRRPINTWKPVGYWLIGSAGLVFGIVVLGGLTRLTESGLSITEWKPVTGTIPPLTHQEWLEEFDKYKQSPEFKILNSNITLSEFQFIFFMEWIHRVWGRTIGISFVLPAAYFIFARKTSPRITGRLILISGLIGLQGFIGWWMVKSGLNEEFLEKPGSHPRVSQYRLATHLGAAVILFVAMVNTGLEVLREARWVKNPSLALKEAAILENPILSRFKKVSLALQALVFITAISGAFVAGLDAGMIYNSFPYMGESIIPPQSEFLDPSFSPNSPSGFGLFWNNSLENPVTAQFNHRVLATTTFFAVLGAHIQSIRLKPFLPKSVMKASGAMMGFASLQVILGISTLIYVVPTSLGAAHQAGALALLTSVLVLCARLKTPRTSIRLLLSTLAKRSKTTNPPSSL